MAWHGVEMLRVFENRDCMEGMAEYSDKFFDLAIVDPPYGLDEKQKNGGTWATETLRQGINWDILPDPNYFQELFRVSNNQIIWGGNYFVLPPSRCFIIWDKTIHGNTLSDCELAWTSFNTPARIYQMNMTFINLEGRIHPTQKGIKLYRWLLENYANPGDKILDTHVGSASSLIACEALGFEYVGFEIDKDYYEAAKKRLETWRSLPLFDEKKAEESNQLELDYEKRYM